MSTCIVVGDWGRPATDAPVKGELTCASTNRAGRRTVTLSYNYGRARAVGGDGLGGTIQGGGRGRSGQTELASVLVELVVVNADITQLEADVIVNAANEHLAHGGGVAAAIARAGAPVVNHESAAWISQNGPLRPGGAAHTRAGPMPASWVVHVVGPRYRADQDNVGLLAGAVVAALDRTAELGGRSVAFPAISSGIFGYPRAEATRVIVDAIRDWAADHPDALDRVMVVGFDAGTTEDFKKAVEASREP